MVKNDGTGLTYYFAVRRLMNRASVYSGKDLVSKFPVIRLFRNASRNANNIWKYLQRVFHFLWAKCFYMLVITSSILHILCPLSQKESSFATFLLTALPMIFLLMLLRLYETHMSLDHFSSRLAHLKIALTSHSHNAFEFCFYFFTPMDSTCRTICLLCCIIFPLQFICILPSLHFH